MALPKAYIKNLQRKAKKEILAAVNEIVKTHPEGEKFFDALDEFIITKASRTMYDYIFAVTEGKTLVMSGGFGRRVAAGIDSGEFPKRPYHLFKGGIRSGASPILLKSTALFDGKAVFIDDTIYGGKTYFAIKDFVNALAGADFLDTCVVIYDGCPTVRNDVSSIFRYYDYFKAKANFKF